MSFFQEIKLVQQATTGTKKVRFADDSDFDIEEDGDDESSGQSYEKERPLKMGKYGEEDDSEADENEDDEEDVPQPSAKSQKVRQIVSFTRIIGSIHSHSSHCSQRLAGETEEALATSTRTAIGIVTAYVASITHNGSLALEAETDAAVLLRMRKGILAKKGLLPEDPAANGTLLTDQRQFQITVDLSFGKRQ